MLARILKITSSVTLTGLLLSNPASAGSLTVRIFDRNDQPVPEVAVSAVPLDGNNEARSQRAGGDVSGTRTATMNQVERVFDPHILVVETGTPVRFPNSDDVRHHVYSFSPAKRFNFSVDSGDVHEQLQFDVPGIVTLGCNIHDEMLAYILVVATPHYALTDGDGTVTLPSLPPGRYEVSVWSPRIASRNRPEPSLVEISAEPLTLEHRIETKLYPPHKHSNTSLEWRGY